MSQLAGNQNNAVFSPENAALRSGTENSLAQNPKKAELLPRLSIYSGPA
jgi:hypothetical protein